MDAEQARTAWWTRLRGAPRSLLICDYDGTLAPFRDNKMEAVPYPGVGERLARLAETGGVTLALVSGRPVGELLQLLPLAAALEVFGSHGREHRRADGRYELAEVSQTVRQALNQAEAKLRADGWAQELERKAGSLAVHWRGFAPGRAAEAQAAMDEIFEAGVAQAPAREPELSLLHFDGGVELRATDATKAHAIETLLRSYPDRPTAYLGDDTTDEDAFVALGRHGLSLLVRAEPRPSAAPFWLSPPEELTAFLDNWLLAAEEAAHAQK